METHLQHDEVSIFWPEIIFPSGHQTRHHVHNFMLQSVGYRLQTCINFTMLYHIAQTSAQNSKHPNC